MKIEINGIRLFFDVDGEKLEASKDVMREKPTLILLHGGPGFDHSLFKPAFAQLTDIVQVVYLDHRGAGRSDRGEQKYWNLGQWADDVKVFCDSLDIQKPVVLGESFGGFVALSYATKYPNHPGKLIFASTKARNRLDRMLSVFERFGGVEARETAERFWTQYSEENLTAYTQLCLPLYYRRDLQEDDLFGLARAIMNDELHRHFDSEEMGDFNFLPDLGNISCPTLVIAGEDDPVTTIEDAMDMVEALPSELVQFKRFENCGHGVREDNPDVYFKVLREFIGGSEAT
jgi:proline iminopeptidase